MGTAPERVKARAEAGAAGRRRYSAAAQGPRRKAGRHRTDRSLPMYALLNLFNTVISIYIWLLIASVVLSWLIAFNVVNTGNRFVYQVRDFLYRITEPRAAADPQPAAQSGRDRHLAGHPDPGPLLPAGVRQPGPRSGHVLAARARPTRSLTTRSRSHSGCGRRGGPRYPRRAAHRIDARPQTAFGCAPEGVVVDRGDGPLLSASLLV